MPDTPEKKLALKEAANRIAKSIDSDLLIFNYEVLSPVDFSFMVTVSNRSRRKNVVLFLITEGGSADSAFRMMRALQSNYERITIVVPGWCKSAGTLMCVGAHELQMQGLGEMGPLDVQIVKADEMDEQKSGLAAEAAFEKLQQESFKFFMGFVRDLGASEYRVTLRTAFDIATKMTVGVVTPIFDKLEPVTIGEDYRSNKLAMAYAERLDAHSKNLKRGRDFDALEVLLSNYQSHGFAIDCKEAKDLFKNVNPISPDFIEVLKFLGTDSYAPRSRRQEQTPRMEFLNDAPEQPTKGSSAANTGAVAGKRVRSKPVGSRDGQLPANPKTRGSAKARRTNGTGKAA